MGTAQRGDCQDSCSWMTPLWWERNLPATLALISAILFACVFQWACLPTAAMRDLFNASINVAAVASGFVGTILAIVFAIKDTRPMRHIRQAGLFDTFRLYLIVSVEDCLLLIPVSLLGIGITYIHADTWVLRLMSSVWVFSSILAAAVTYRVIRVMHSCLR